MLSRGFPDESNPSEYNTYFGLIFDTDIVDRSWSG